MRLTVKRMTGLSVIAWALGASFLSGGRAAAQSVDWPERWAAVLKDTDRFLAAGEPDRAHRILSALVREIVDASRPNDQADAQLAVAMTQLAVAEAAGGRTDDAVWNWHIAQNIVRDVAAGVDLGAYGEPGELLQRNSGCARALCPDDQQSLVAFDLEAARAGVSRRRSTICSRWHSCCSNRVGHDRPSAAAPGRAKAGRPFGLRDARRASRMAIRAKTEQPRPPVLRGLPVQLTGPNVSD